MHRGEILERVGAHDEHAAAGEHRERARHGRGRRQRERAGAGNDEHRHASPRTRATDRRSPSRRRCIPRAPARARRSRPPRARRRAPAAASWSPRASSSATMPATTVSAPTRVTRMIAGVPATTLPAHNASPRRFWRRRRFAAEQRLVDAALLGLEHAIRRNAAALGDASPDRPARARMRPRAAAIRRPRMRSANTGVSRASASVRSPARWRARISR